MKHQLMLDIIQICWEFAARSPLLPRNASRAIDV